MTHRLGVRFAARLALLALPVVVACAAACFVELDAPAVADAGDAGDAGATDAGEASCAAFSRVQQAHTNTFTGRSADLALTLTGAQNAGDILLVGVNYVDCTPVQRIADSKGNAYERLVSADTMGDAGTLETWSAKNVAAAAAGTNTVTITFGGPCVEMNMKVVEYGGVDPAAPVETTTSMHGTGGAPTATLTVPARELLFAHTADGIASTGAGAGWTFLFEDEWKTIAQERITPGAGTYPVTFQPTSGESWVIQGVALRCR
jgi:hypothetical protein